MENERVDLSCSYFVSFCYFIYWPGSVSRNGCRKGGRVGAWSGCVPTRSLGKRSESFGGFSESFGGSCSSVPSRSEVFRVVRNRSGIARSAATHDRTHLLGIVSSRSGIARSLFRIARRSLGVCSESLGDRSEFIHFMCVFSRYFVSKAVSCSQS